MCACAPVTTVTGGAPTRPWPAASRVWFGRGMWWASRDGDKLSGDSPAALETVLCDHMALCRDRPQSPASGG